MVLVQHTLGDGFWTPRTDYYGIVAMPTACGNGVSDVWPFSWLEVDYQAHAAEASPLTISLHENAEGDFTAHIEAEESVGEVRVCMVATLDEYVLAFAGGQSHLPYHVVAFMTDTSGDRITLDSGEKTDIRRTFDVQPSWDYAKMGVACWVQQAGGTNPSPQPYGDIPIKNKVLQSAWVAAGSTDVADDVPVASVSLAPPWPNPSSGETTLRFTLPQASSARLEIFDVAGRRVAVPAEGEFAPGEHESTWDGRDASGHVCVSGVYMARLTVGTEFAAGTKLVMLR